MDDIDSKIADMESDLQRLSTAIEALGERLGRGESAVRAELNSAIRRERALSSELYALKIATGRAKVEPPILYGPPWPPREVGRTDDLTRGGLLRRLFRRK